MYQTVTRWAGSAMTILIILVLLALFGILGAVVEGLIWLTLIAAVLFVAGLAFGYFKFKRR